MTAPNPSRYRNICVTVNNPERDGPAQLLQWQADLPCSYIACQKEQVTTPHFQAYLEFSKQVTHATLVKKMEGAHFEARRGTPAQARDYCILPEHNGEDKGRIDGPWEWGEISQPGKRSDMSDTIVAAQTQGIQKAAELYPETYARNARGIERVVALTAKRTLRDVEVILLIGPGGVGKSYSIWNAHDPDKVATADGNLKWFDDFNGQPILFIDEFRGEFEGASPTLFNKILDRYPLKLPTKGGFTNASYTRVYIATNYHPRTWFHLESVGYNALKRRFATVIAWDVGNNTPRAPDHTWQRDTDEFNDFWNRHYW